VTAIFAGVAAVGGGALWWWRTKVGKELALMEATETSTAAAVPSQRAGTVVELKGALRCQAPLSSEFAQQSCVYYRTLTEREYEDIRRDSEGRTQRERRYQTMTDNIRHAPCVLEDATGSVRLTFEGAKVEAMEVVKRYESGGGSMSAAPRWVTAIPNGCLPTSTPMFSGPSRRTARSELRKQTRSSSATSRRRSGRRISTRHGFG